MTGGTVGRRRTGRRPGASGSRESILQAARALFAEVGYDRTTMRAVAARAGVDPALIHHFFGSKERLLTATLEFPFDPAQVLAGVGEDPDHAGAQIVRRLLAVWDASRENRDRMVGMLRAALSHEGPAAAMRDLLSRTVLSELRGIVADDTADLRAGLIGTQLGGLVLGRYVLRIPALADASHDELVAAIGPAIQHYVTGPITPSAGH